jgi:hypothetical protein
MATTNEPSINEQILDLRDVLRIAEQDKTITPDGQKMLKDLDTESWSTGGFGQFLQGLTLNFSDSAIANIKSIFKTEPTNIASQIGAMNTDRQPPSARQVAGAMEEIGLKEYAAANPVKSAAANLGGAVLPSLVTKRPLVTGLPAQMGLAGAVGFTSGVGESEAELFSPESYKSGAGSAALGVGITAALKPVSLVAGNVYKSLVKSIFDNPQRLGTDEARQLVKQALVSDVGGIDEAIQFILKSKNKPYALADIGPNTQAYLDAAASIPGPGKQIAKDFLENRDKGILQRLTSDLQVAFGSKAAFFDEFAALKTARSDLGGKLYDRALQKDVPINAELTKLFERPSVQAAYDRAIRIAREEGVKLPNVKIVNGKLQTESGNPITDINTTFLHYMKMGLDDVVYNSKNPASGVGTTELAKVKGTRIEFLNQLDAANPRYKTAREFWAGDTSVLDAMENGRTVFNKTASDVDILLNDVKSMNKSELEGLRLGVMQNLLDQLGGAQTAATLVSATGNPALKILQNNKNLRIIRETFPKDEAGDKAYSVFIKNLTDEVQMKGTSKIVLQGSQTAQRQQAIADVKAGGQAMREMPMMSFQSIIQRAVQRDLGQLGDAQTRAVADELTRILTAQDPKKLAKIAKELAGRSIYDIASKDAPELLAALGRATIGPYAVGSMAGNAGPNISQMVTPQMRGMFSQ